MKPSTNCAHKPIQSRSRRDIRDFIGIVEDDLAYLAGYEFDAAQLAGFVETMRRLGQVDDDRAQELLQAAYRLAERARRGLKHARWTRNPPMEVELLVLTNGRSFEQEQGADDE